MRTLVFRITFVAILIGLVMMALVMASEKRAQQKQLSAQIEKQLRDELCTTDPALVAGSDVGFVDPLKDIVDPFYAIGQKNLGIRRLTGKPVPRNLAEALASYHEAAEQGNADAQHNLGMMFANGMGVPQDYVQAIQWFLIAQINGASVDTTRNLHMVESNATPTQRSQAQINAQQWRRTHPTNTQSIEKTGKSVRGLA